MSIDEHRGTVLREALDAVSIRDRRLADLEQDLVTCTRRVSDELRRRQVLNGRIAELEEQLRIARDELAWWQGRASVLPCRVWWFLRSRLGAVVRRVQARRAAG